MDSTLKLVFQTVCAGSGLAEVNSQTATLQKRLGKLGQGAQVLGGAFSSAFGGLGGVIGRSLGMLLSGGVWGAAAMAIFGCAKAVSKWRDDARKARLAAKGLSEDFGSLERQTRAYQNTLARYRAHKAAVDKANADAEKESAEAERRREQSLKAAISLENDFYSLEAQIAAEKLKAGLADEDELARLKAQGEILRQNAAANVDAAKRGIRQADEGVGNKDLAQKRYELALEQQKNAELSARRLLENYEKAKRKAAEAEALRKREEEARAKAAEKRERDREDAARREADVRKKAAEAVKRIDEQIAAKRAEAAALEENAARARGVNFGDWQRGERDRGRAERSAERKQRNREASVDAEIARIEATSPMARSKWQRDRLAKLRTWKQNQDPDNNPAAQAADALEKQKVAVLDRQEKLLAEIKQDLRKNLSL